MSSRDTNLEVIRVGRWWFTKELLRNEGVMPKGKPTKKPSKPAKPKPKGYRPTDSAPLNTGLELNAPTRPTSPTRTVQI